MPSFEFRDGEMVQVPDIVVNESGEWAEDVNRTLIIQSGADLIVHGRIGGTVRVESGASLEAHNNVGGTVTVADGGRATFHSGMGGTLKVQRGGVATLTESAVALGTMRIEGALVNHGTRGQQVSGSGTVDDREGSTVRPPDEVLEDGTTIYRS